MFKKSGDVQVTGKPITVKEAGDRGRGKNEVEEAKKKRKKEVK